MRSGAAGCAAQQTLSPEAGSVLKHALALARRRGHAQVTPLHVAATLLGSKTSVLKRACLKSQSHNHHHPSHPLQCRALDLCFNVALSRLPATAAPLFNAQPSLSNALVAALKRAQAHQRRGCVEQQQQSVIAVKVELDLLILSILDDPSVSRVMREAGFSSTLVKNSLEDFSSNNSVSSVFLGYGSPGGGIYSTPNSPPNENPTNFWHSQLYKEELGMVFDVLLRKKRRKLVIIGDSEAVINGLVTEFMAKFEAGDVPEEMKHAHLIKFQFLSSLPFMKTEEVETIVDDLKRRVDESFGVVIYTGDLKWTIEDGTRTAQGDGYSPVDHLVSEISKLVSLHSERIWLVSSASYQTYLKSQMRKPPLDLQWSLEPVPVPCNGFSLTLNTRTNSGQDARSFCLNEEDDVLLTCCKECKLHYEKEAALKPFSSNCSSPNPFWLKQLNNNETSLKELRRKYNKLCSNLHQQRRNSALFSTWPDKKAVFADSEIIPLLKPAPTASPPPKFRRQQSCHIEFSFSSKNRCLEPNLDSLRVNDDKEVKISLALGNSAYVDEVPSEKLELGADLSLMLQENLPWQSESIPLILEMVADQTKFILIHGNDLVAKRRLAIGIAESFFGSPEFLFHMKLKRNSKDVLEKALRDHERRVVLIEDVESADPDLARLLSEIYETGFLEKFAKYRKTVFILTTDAESNENEEMDRVIQMKLVITELPQENGIGAGDPVRKRKADSGMQNTSKSQRKLDLNIEADDDEAPKPLKFLETIKNRIVLNTNSEKQRLATEMLASKINRSFNQENISAASFNIEESVLDATFKGCGLYLNSSFERWLEEVFRPSLWAIDTEGKRLSISLCLGCKEGGGGDDGFMGTCLPKRIPVCWTS